MALAKVSSRGAARWRRGHPWIYRSDVLERPASEAGVVGVVDERGRWVGSALWSPASTISLRMLTTSEAEVDVSFFEARIEAALAYRRALAPDATAYRLVHAEADGLPSLVVDRYDEWLVVQLLSAGLEAVRDTIVDVLQRQLEPRGILARNDVPVRRHEALPRSVELLAGSVPDRVEVREGDVRYLVDVWAGQKTGAFLDQRENRCRAGELARGRVLDCFAYHGSFALHLAQGGAHSVVALDSSGPALERASENARLNGLDAVRTVEGNVFDYLRGEAERGARYDVIVLDPPAFAKRRGAVEAALRGYKEINLRAMRLLEPGGYLLTFSCSHHVEEPAFHAMLKEAAADAGRVMRRIEVRGQAADHPVILQVPESGYLKGAVLQARD